MLHLAAPTDPQWFDRVAPHLDVLLIDHAHLEKRAASTALAMIFRYTGRPGLARRLSDVVQEEMEHFSRVLDIIERRSIDFTKIEPANYASTLAGHVRKQEPWTLLDKLLVAALIEARSCERFAILGERVEDRELRALYRNLFESEARHHTLYTGIARECFPADDVKQRLDELAEREVEALRGSSEHARLHSF